MSTKSECRVCTICVHREGKGHAGNLYDLSAQAELARRIARLGGGTVVEPGDVARSELFLIPDDTMLLEHAAAEGIAKEAQLYGGVVPNRFVATKIVTHGLLSESAPAPAGWQVGLAAELGDAVLRGFSVFSWADARAAGRLLLRHGPIRLKDVEGTSCSGQVVIRGQAELDRAIAALDTEILAQGGLVIEENLEPVMTYSVGISRLFGQSIAYWGTQRLTRNNHENEVYGGSQLHCVRGGWAELMAIGGSAGHAEVIQKAWRYDRAVFAAYPTMFASRRNYDVAVGWDALGDRKIGVLEQSWRMGGASGAEIAAFEAFAADPSLQTVDTATVEIYGAAGAVPPGASVYFSGNDPVVGPLTKYAVVS